MKVNFSAIARGFSIDLRQTGGNMNAGKSHPEGVSNAGLADKVETTGLSSVVAH